MNDSTKTKSELLHEVRRLRASDTDRKRVEAALRKSEELHRLTLEHISDAIFIVEDSGRFNYICPNVNVIFGYSVEEVRAMDNIAQLLGSHLCDCEELEASGELCNIEQKIFDKGGRRHDLLVNCKQVALFGGTRLYSCRDVTDRKRAEEALLLQQEELRTLTAKLVAAGEEERKHLARELHDVYSQRLAVLAMDVGLLQSGSTSPEGVRESLRSIEERIGEFADDLHQISRQLHPSVLDDLGLVVALKNECRVFSKQYDIPTRVTTENVPASIPEDIQLCLYRVLQEILQNIARHAEADEVLATLTGSEEDLVLSVRDRGQGFDPEKVRGKGGLGLVSMKERVRLVNGSLSVRSQPGRGTEIEVQIPLDS